MGFLWLLYCVAFWPTGGGCPGRCFGAAFIGVLFWALVHHSASKIQRSHFQGRNDYMMARRKAEGRAVIEWHK